MAGKKRTNPLQFVAAGMACLLFGVVLLVVYSGNISDADRKADWLESTAIIGNPLVVEEHIDTFSDDDDKYDYRVTFEFYISYDTGDETQSFLSTFEKTGEADRSSIPDSAYDFYADGEGTPVTYDPQNPTDYVFGLKDDVIAGLQDKVPLYAGYVGVGLAALFFLITILRMLHGRNTEEERNTERTTL